MGRPCSSRSCLPKARMMQRMRERKQASRRQPAPMLPPLNCLVCSCNRPVQPLDERPVRPSRPCVLPRLAIAPPRYRCCTETQTSGVACTERCQRRTAHRSPPGQSRAPPGAPGGPYAFAPSRSRSKLPTDTRAVQAQDWRQPARQARGRRALLGVGLLVALPAESVRGPGGGRARGHSQPGRPATAAFACAAACGQGRLVGTRAMQSPVNAPTRLFTPLC